MKKIQKIQSYIKKKLLISDNYVLGIVKANNEPNINKSVKFSSKVNKYL